MKTPGAMAGLVRSPEFLRLWVLGGLVNALRWVEMLAAGLFVFAQTGSGVAVALVLAARSLPLLCFGALAGVLADSVSRKKILMVGMLLSATAAASICVLDLTGQVQPWHLACAAFVSGSVWSTEMSTRRRMIGECGGPGLVSRVVALDSLTNSLARIAGPLAGSLAFAYLGLRGAYGMSAVLYLGSALLVPGLSHVQATRRLRLSHVLRDLAESFAYAWRSPVVLTVLGVTATMNVFAFSYSAMVAPIARAGFLVPDAMAGLLPAGEPLGALLGGLLLAVRAPRSNPRLLMLGGSAAFLAGVAVMPLMPSFGAACLALVLGGLGLAVFGNMQTSLILTATPSGIRSRQLGLITVSIGISPVGQVLIGLLAEAFGPLAAVMICASSGLAVLGLIAVLSAGIGPALRAACANKRSRTRL